MTRPASLAQAFDEGLTAEEWREEFIANICCPNPSVAAARFCGCGGSGQLPTGVSRLLFDPNHTEED